jgi:hypothetical protein
VERYFGSPHENTPLVIYGLFFSHHFRDLAPMPWIAKLPCGTEATSCRRTSAAAPADRRKRRERIGLWPLESRSAAVTLAHLGVMT